MYQTNIPFGRNPARPLRAVTADDGSLTLKDANGCPLLTLSIGKGCYGLRVENICDLEWGVSREKIEDLESLVIREALKLVVEVETGNLTRENLKEMVENTGHGEPALALKFLDAKGIDV